MYSKKQQLSSFFGSCLDQTVTATTTTYMQINGSTTTEAGANVLFSLDGNFQYGYVRTRTAQSANNSMVFTLRVNGADTSIVITIAAGSAAGLYSDLIHTAPISAGQVTCWKVVNNANVASANITGSGIYCYGKDTRWSKTRGAVSGVGGSGTFASGTLYTVVLGSGGVTTENQRQSLVPRNMIAEQASIRTGSTQPAGNTMTWTLRKETGGTPADTSIVITIAGSSVAGVYSDLTHTASYLAGDLIGWKVVNTTTSAQILGKSFIYYATNT